MDVLSNVMYCWSSPFLEDKRKSNGKFMYSFYIVKGSVYSNCLRVVEHQGSIVPFRLALYNCLPHNNYWKWNQFLFQLQGV